ncbi:MAG: undecaprenyldiphospho-muramoylpentapeptide beta-N-acetylglucosaminyltransferase [Bacteroidota bacterium]
MATKKIIISGGGSGGHIFPAIAIANALRESDKNIEILFIGALGKIEMEKVPKAGYPIEGLWISGLHRGEIVRNLLFPFKLLSSLWKAFRLIGRFQPDIVIGVGGFASGPTLEVASRRGIPTLIQEQNSYPGLTNRLLAKRVRKICVAYEGMDKYFPADRIVMTGNPVRQDIQISDAKRAEAAAHFGLDADKPTILIFGGSLGAKAFNESMTANAEGLKARPDVQVLWQAGKLYYEQYKNCETAQLPNVEIRAFLDRMDLAYSLAGVVICRAGALTIAELCLLGRAAVLIPSPNVAEDHQTYNARALVDKGAAVLVKDSAAKEKMIPAAIEILENPEKRADLEARVKGLEQRDAATKIAAEVMKLLK